MQLPLSLVNLKEGLKNYADQSILQEAIGVIQKLIAHNIVIYDCGMISVALLIRTRLINRTAIFGAAVPGSAIVFMR